MFQIIWMIVVGFVVGLIARAVMPGADQFGFWLTAGLGIIGSLVGGFLSRLFSRPAENAVFHPAGFVMSIVGAVIVLVVARMIR